MLHKVHRELLTKASAGRRAIYQAQIVQTDRLLNWLSDERQSNVGAALKAYVSAMVVAHKSDELRKRTHVDSLASTSVQSRKTAAGRLYHGSEAEPTFAYPANKIVGDLMRPALALFLSEGATADEKETLTELLMHVGYDDQITRALSTMKKRLLPPWLTSSDARAVGTRQRRNSSSGVAALWQRASNAVRGAQRTGQLQEMLRIEALKKILLDLAVSVHCVSVVVVPVSKPHEYLPLVPLLVTLEDFDEGEQDDANQETAATKSATRRRLRESVRENEDVSTPGGMCLAQRDAILVDCYPLDARFGVASKRAGLSSLSQLCVPIFAFDKTLGAHQKPVVIGILKCVNKVKFSGGSAGVPFDPQFDVQSAVAAAAEFAEAAQMFFIRRQAMRVIGHFMTAITEKKMGDARVSRRSAESSVVDADSGLSQSLGKQHERARTVSTTVNGFEDDEEQEGSSGWA